MAYLDLCLVAQLVIGILLWERPLPTGLRWIGSILVAGAPSLLLIIPVLQHPANDWAGLTLALGEMLLAAGVITLAIGGLVGALIRRRRNRT